MPSSILLISPEAPALIVAEALRRSLNLVSVRASSRRAGLAALRRDEYTLVLLDEGLAEADLVATDILFQSAGTAPVLEIDFGSAGPVRIVRQVRSALHRRAQDEARARIAAAASLQNELRASLSGLLVESQLALREANPAQAPKLRHLVELAGDLRDRLRA